MQKVKIKGQSVQKLEWKQTDAGDCISAGANVVGYNRASHRR